MRVAVRVRPFSSKEVDSKAKCIVSMSGNQVTIRDPVSGKSSRTFAYDAGLVDKGNNASGANFQPALSFLWC